MTFISIYFEKILWAIADASSIARRCKTLSVLRASNTSDKMMKTIAALPRRPKAGQPKMYSRATTHESLAIFLLASLIITLGSNLPGRWLKSPRAPILFTSLAVHAPHLLPSLTRNEILFLSRLPEEPRRDTDATRPLPACARAGRKKKMAFASLPYELRSVIWSLAVEPRRINKVRTIRSDGGFTAKQRRRGQDVLYETTSTPPPSLMHACRESRLHAPYRRAFTAGTRPRWTWVNFDLDVFCVSSLYAIDDIGPQHRPDVRRLRISTDDHRGWYDSATIHGGLRILDEFPNLGHLQIVLDPGDLMWADVFSEWGLGRCPADIISFVDEGSGLVLTGPQLRLVSDWRIFFSFDSDGNPPAEDELEDQIDYISDDTWHLTMEQMHHID